MVSRDFTIIGDKLTMIIINNHRVNNHTGYHRIIGPAFIAYWLQNQTSGTPFGNHI